MSEFPAHIDLRVYSGDKYVQEFTFTDEDDNPFDFTGHTVTAQWRPYRTSSTFVNFAVTVTNAAGGVLEIKLTGAQTANLTSGVWDLQTSSGDADGPRTLVNGDVEVVRQVTR